MSLSETCDLDVQVVESTPLTLLHRPQPLMGARVEVEMLRTETNSSEMAKRVSRAFANWAKEKHINCSFDVFFEHGQHWVKILQGDLIGAEYSVIDSNRPGGFDFELVSGPYDY